MTDMIERKYEPGKENRSLPGKAPGPKGVLDMTLWEIWLSLWRPPPPDTHTQTDAADGYVVDRRPSDDDGDGG